MTPDLKPEPIFKKADLEPLGVMFMCPSCRTQGEAELADDDFGNYSVPMESRYVQCAECGQNLDIGWAGWQWHDGRGEVAP